MKKLFRLLEANEIEVRQGRKVGEEYVELLLYKNARVDYNVLDETVGVYNWQCDYKEVNGVVYCGIGIRDNETGEWQWKWNAGAEGQIEKEKAAASDAFKRAGFAWGLGRELYTAPRIVVPSTDKYAAYSVSEIEYDSDDRISAVTVINQRGDVVYKYPGGANTKFTYSNPTANTSSKTNKEKLKDFCTSQKTNPEVNNDVLLKFFNYYNKIEDLDTKTYFKPDTAWKKWVERERN
ncbi:Rad52/Rad22 family DNA repair protein [Fibrobacter sp.]|uniref:Rad52/Rad22 family DNA repair protein n=1 Tax=Fibrobacter sp. TaxID=35828 RepID=UPI00386C4C64